MLSRAIAGGETALRRVVRDTQIDRDQIRNGLRYRGKGSRSGQAIKARQQICAIDRVIAYATMALSHLPTEPIARAKAVQCAIETGLQLGTGSD